MFKKGRSNLALTIFVPWDCKNHCKFCTVKEEYKNLKLDFDAVIKTLNEVFFIDEIKDIVISGGEPLGDIDKFIKLIENIEELQLKSKHIKNLFINTTLPKLSEEDESKFISLLSRCHIYGFNISRHIGVNFDKIDDSLMYDIKKVDCCLRVNSVIQEWNGTDDEKTAVKGFVEHWLKYCDDVSFRWDYRKVNDIIDLKTLDNPFLQYLNTFLDYRGSSGCHVCNDDYFEMGRVHFHRGCRSTLLKFGEYLLVNDIIIKPDGTLHLDWETNPIDVAELKF